MVRVNGVILFSLLSISFNQNKVVESKIQRKYELNVDKRKNMR